VLPTNGAVFRLPQIAFIGPLEKLTGFAPSAWRILLYSITLGVQFFENTIGCINSDTRRPVRGCLIGHKSRPIPRLVVPILTWLEQFALLVEQAVIGEHQVAQSLISRFLPIVILSLRKR